MKNWVCVGPDGGSYTSLRPLETFGWGVGREIASRKESVRRKIRVMSRVVCLRRVPMALSDHAQYKIAEGRLVSLQYIEEKYIE